MTTQTQSELIQSQLRAFERQMQYARGTRFERLLIPRNLIDTTTSAEQKQSALARDAARVQLKDRYLPAEFRRDPQYSVDVGLAARDEDIYGLLVDPTPGTYQVRAEISQHHPGPLFQGCVLRWVLPSGWSFADGHGALTYAEIVSNPLVITRLATYSSGKAGWKVIVDQWYRA